MTLEERLAQGDRAKEILDNEAFHEAFNAIEQDLISKWKATPARDAAGRESLWTYLQMAYKFREQLTSTLETGKLAALEIQHQRSLHEFRSPDWKSE